MDSLISIINAIGLALAVLGGALAGVFIIYAGIQWMMAAGDPQKMAQARNSLIGAFVGVVIIGVGFIIPGVISEFVLEAGGIEISSDLGVDCDGLLRSQLVFQRTASTTNHMQVLITTLQARRAECAPPSWTPKVKEGLPTGCVDAGTGGSDSAIGGIVIPRGLMSGTDGATMSSHSGRDAYNNILVYWSDDVDQKPSDGSVCWLYIDSFNAWRYGY